jgi:flavin-binding protein dodecin
LKFGKKRRKIMSESVYKIIELVGSSPTSWEEAAKNAVETAGKTLKDLRIAEITQMDVKIENGKVTAYRAKVNLSFKYQPTK